MASFDSDSNAISNDPSPPAFAPSPLDMDFDDDEEFRAGYPFTHVQESESIGERCLVHQ
jgi:hypothetical protein